MKFLKSPQVQSFLELFGVEKSLVQELNFLLGCLACQEALPTDKLADVLAGHLDPDSAYFFFLYLELLDSLVHLVVELVLLRLLVALMDVVLSHHLLRILTLGNLVALSSLHHTCLLLPGNVLIYLVLNKGVWHHFLYLCRIGWVRYALLALIVLSVIPI